MSRDEVHTFVGALAQAGWFTHDPSTDAWWWSEGMYRIHGYEPGEVVPDGDLMLRHKHPDDRDVVLAAREQAYATTEPVSCSHRILTRDGDLRSVVTVGRCEPAADGRAGVLHGFMTDLTDTRVAGSRAVADAAVRSAMGSRAVIEQAKGALMLTYGIGPDAAFNVLRRHSQHRNLRLADVAQAFVDSFAHSHWVTQVRPVLGDVLDRHLDGAAEPPQRPKAGGSAS